jgi:hypothetical protein
MEGEVRDMKFCPVVPPSCYSKLPTPPHGLFSFAGHCFSEPGYGDFFRSWNATTLQDERGPLVIDNPIYEGAGHLDSSGLRQIAKLMAPDFMIVPDVRGKLEPTLDYYKTYAARIGPCATGVLQGQTWMELEQCYIKMYEMGCRKFAIPKDVIKIDVYRSELCMQMTALAVDEIEIHLLGGDWPYVDEAKAGQILQVKSFDSAEPFNSAMAHEDIAKAPPPHRPQGFLSITPRILGDGFDHYFGRNIETVERLAKCN